MLVARRYDLGGSLGRGGMGQVWRAFDQVLGREVAVKLLHPGLTTESVAARFRREARSAARISNPHVVAVYDFGVDDDRLFLVTELVEGPSLATELRRTGPLTSERVASLLLQAAGGLASAHTHGVVHRDVKPSNLLLASGPSDDRDSVLKIADFGIARVTDDPAEPLTAAGEVTGTSQYLAPERALGEPGGPPADVYSLGCVGYHLLTGRPPYEGDAPTTIAYQHVHGTLVPPHEITPDVDPALEDVMLRMLAKDPEKRPTAHELTGHLARLIDGTPVPPADADGVGEPTDRELDGPEGRRPRRATTRPLLAAAAVALVAGSAVVWATMRTGVNADDPPADSTTSFVPGGATETFAAGLPTPVSETAPPTDQAGTADPTRVGVTDGFTVGPTAVPTPAAIPGVPTEPSFGTTFSPTTTATVPPVPPTAGSTTTAPPPPTATSSPPTTTGTPPTTSGPTPPATTTPPPPPPTTASTPPTATPTGPRTPRPKPTRPPKPTPRVSAHNVTSMVSDWSTDSTVRNPSDS